MTTEAAAPIPAMDVDDAVGAASRAATDWHQIDWYRAQRLVCRLQARLVQATQAGRWGKVKALQRLLTHSSSGKVVAVRRVTENHGKHTPGVDQVIWDTPEKKAQAVHALRARGYQPQPARRVHIPKSNGKTRPLGILTMHDRAMQTLYLLALAPVAETHADLHSYGFRPDRSTADAMAQCYTMDHTLGYTWLGKAGNAGRSPDSWPVDTIALGHVDRPFAAPCPRRVPGCGSWPYPCQPYEPERRRLATGSESRLPPLARSVWAVASRAGW